MNDKSCGVKWQLQEIGTVLSRLFYFIFKALYIYKHLFSVGILINKTEEVPMIKLHLLNVIVRNLGKF